MPDRGRKGRERLSRVIIEEDNRKTDPMPPITFQCGICGATIAREDAETLHRCFNCIEVEARLPRFLRSQVGRDIVKKLLELYDPDPDPK